MFLILVCFLGKNCNSPWKKLPPSFPATPSQSWDPFKPPLFGNLVGGSTFPSRKDGGVHIVLINFNMLRFGITSKPLSNIKQTSSEFQNFLKVSNFRIFGRHFLASFVQLKNWHYKGFPLWLVWDLVIDLFCLIQDRATYWNATLH